MAYGDSYRNRRVLVTGHSGFKGAWLTEWLLALGADVTGFSLAPPTQRSLFEQLGLAKRMLHVEGDVRSLEEVRSVVESSQAEFIFHLAAQPLVRLSYYQPVETYATNIMGTVNVLEAARRSGRPCVIVAVTTDKCYENREWLYGYRESDPMGGYDPYSSSKGAAELVISAYRRSFFNDDRLGIAVASARAGNVIGGGDWALDRIVPDCMRALISGQAIPVRNKTSTRPWQHVLEPLSGYLALGAALADPKGFTGGSPTASAFNFGPSLCSNKTVLQLVEEVLKHWPGHWEDHSDPRAHHEAQLLNLATDKAQHLLHWAPVWPFGRTVAETVRWYRESEMSAANMLMLTKQQISAYNEDAKHAGLDWAQ